MTTLDDVRSDSLRYGPLAYLATVTPAGEPHVAPTAVAWYGDEILTFVRTDSRKVANLRTNSRIAVHFAVGPTTNWDSCIVRGDVVIEETNAGRTNLWDKMGYDLAAFEPGGPQSDNHLFFRVRPTRATVLRAYGLKGRETWVRSTKGQS